MLGAMVLKQVVLKLDNGSELTFNPDANHIDECKITQILGHSGTMGRHFTEGRWRLQIDLTVAAYHTDSHDG